MGAVRAVPAGQLPLPPALPAAAGQLLDQARRALVVDGGRLAGLLSATDVMRILEIAQTGPRGTPTRPRPHRCGR